MKPFLTGSRAYGPIKPFSDIDIVVSKQTSKQLQTIFNILNIRWNKVNEDYIDSESIYVTIENKLVNFIAVDKEYIPNWKHATQKMKKIDPIKNRSERLAQFQDFMQEYIE